MSSYLEVKDGNFVRDIELDFSVDKYYQKLNSLKRGEWCIAGKDREWFDGEIDIKDIPPSLFFLVLVNTYSSGFSLSVPLDMSYERFFKLVAAQFENPLNKKIVYKIYFDGGNIDIAYLNKTGKIKSIKQWNSVMSMRGLIWSYNGKSLGTIQSIVETCRSCK
jgi:hypothetical protein